MMRDSAPNTTTPGRAGSLAAVAAAAFSAAAACAMPGDQRDAHAAVAGTGNSCDVSVSPSTVVVACTSVPGASR